MNYSKSILAATLLAATGAAQAELSANLGVQSNYYFRGVTQTDDSAAISGGIDYGHESGFYLGTWMSNVDFGGKEDVEIDGYAGFGGDIGDTGLGYDLSAWYYWYPGAGGEAQAGDIDYAEASGSLSWSWLTGTVAYTFWSEVEDVNEPRTFNEGDVYFNLAVAPDWSYEGFAPTASVGYYSFDDDGDCNTCDFNYYHWNIGVSKDAGDFGSFSITYEQIDDANDAFGDDNPNFWLGWAKDF